MLPPPFPRHFSSLALRRQRLLAHSFVQMRDQIFGSEVPVLMKQGRNVLFSFQVNVSVTRTLPIERSTQYSPPCYGAPIYSNFIEVFQEVFL